MSGAWLAEALPPLLPNGLEAGLVTRMDGGGNNQLYRVDTAEGAFVLKRYFRDPGDPRDRLGAEWAFSTFLWNSGIHCLPKPVAQDPQRGLGLYAFVPGRPLAAEEIGEPEVIEALAFLRAIQAHRGVAKHLPAASEARFSLRQHVDGLDLRMTRLDQVAGSSEADREARGFIEDRLCPAWAALRARLLAGPELDRELAEAERIVSPSDFGFHNALRGEDGRLLFLDFEYAGWDDPAKTVGDFFSQVALPAPPAAFDGFARALAADLPDPAATLARMHRLRPLYRLKWCCIVLNHFLPLDQRRRAFAEGGSASAEASPQAKAAQLEKARALLEALPEPEP